VSPASAPLTTPPRGRNRRVERVPRGGGRVTALSAHGEPMIWLTGGSLALALLMIVGLLVLVAVQGFGTFWPVAVTELRTADGQVLAGEITRAEEWTPPGEAGPTRRRLLRTGNFELSGEHFRWVDDGAIAEEGAPAWGLVVERLTWGRFYGVPVAFQQGGQVVAQGPEASWAAFEQHHARVRERWEERRELETEAIGEVNRDLERQRLRLREIELREGATSPAYARSEAEFEDESARLTARYDALRERIQEIDAENDGYRLVLATADGREQPLPLAEIVRAYPANQLDTADKLGIYLSRWAEFLLDDPREANSEGGVFPAIFGTVVMTLVMALMVVPFGVLAALFLREFA
jgi:phosphate transport system permease protein